MERPSPGQLETARRLMAREALADGGPALAAARAHEKVRLHVAPILGAAGFLALFARSLHLAKAEHPCFGRATAHRDAGAQADLVRVCLQDQAPEAATESAVALFATFFALLATFIGDRLTAQVLLGIWPDASDPATRERNK